MRTRVAGLLLVILAALVVADPLVCPDGCTDEGSAPLSAAKSGPACALCQAGVTVRDAALPGVPASRPGLAIRAHVPRPRRASHRDIDHPPRVS